MAITFDPTNKRIILDSTSITAEEIWSRWADWAAQSDNLKYLPACSQVGGDDLGGGLYIPIYIFLLNDWRVRPMEANQTLNITGNLFVDGGGTPIVPTLGTFNVIAQYTVPVQAQGISTSGSDPSAIASAVWGHNTAALIAIRMAEVWARLGLDASQPITTGLNSITFGDIVMAITESGTDVIVTRQ